MIHKTAKYLSWLLLVAYVVGKGLQFLSAGPSWLRWHLSDLGFVAGLTMLVELVFRGTKFEKAAMKWQMATCLAGLVLALLSEALQKSPDPVDFFCFLLGSVPPIIYLRSR